MEEVNNYSMEMIDLELQNIEFTTSDDDQHLICDNFHIGNVSFETIQYECMELPNISLVQIR